MIDSIHFQFYNFLIPSHFTPLLIWIQISHLVSTSRPAQAYNKKAVEELLSHNRSTTISIQLFHLFSTSLFSLLCFSLYDTRKFLSMSLLLSTGWVGRSSQSPGIGRTKRSFKCTTLLVHDILQFHQFPVSKYFTLCFHQICLFRQSCWVCGSLERPGEGMTKRRRGRGFCTEGMTTRSV